MIKKVFIGIVIAAAFGLLVLGAVNRTLAKSVENEPLALSEGSGGENGGGSGNGGGGNNSSNGTGNQNQTAPGSPEDCDEEGEAYGGPGNDRSSNNNDGTGEPALDGTGYQGGGNQDAGGGQGGPGEGGLGEGEAEVEAWETLEGVLSSKEDDLWIITLNDGSTLEIEGRALSFALKLGFQASTGDQLQLTGFYEDGDFEVGAIQNLTTGESVTLREESGRPLWAGGGRGGNQ